MPDPLRLDMATTLGRGRSDEAASMARELEQLDDDTLKVLKRVKRGARHSPPIGARFCLVFDSAHCVLAATLAQRDPEGLRAFKRVKPWKRRLSPCKIAMGELEYDPDARVFEFVQEQGNASSNALRKALKLQMAPMKDFKFFKRVRVSAPDEVQSVEERAEETREEELLATSTRAEIDEAEASLRMTEEEEAAFSELAETLEREHSTFIGLYAALAQQEALEDDDGLDDYAEFFPHLRAMNPHEPIDEPDALGPLSILQLQRSARAIRSRAISDLSSVTESLPTDESSVRSWDDLVASVEAFQTLLERLRNTP